MILMVPQVSAKVVKMTSERKDSPDKKKNFILGDRMIKTYQRMGAVIKNISQHSIYVRSFSGAKVRSMKDYVKPCMRKRQVP